MQIIDPLKLVAKLWEEKEKAIHGIENASTVGKYYHWLGRNEALNDIIEWVTVNIEDLKKGE